MTGGSYIMDILSQLQFTIAAVTTLLLKGTDCTPMTNTDTCPADAVSHMSKCTEPLITFKQAKDRTTLTKYCRLLKQVPICLEKILHQCQGQEEQDSIDSMKATIGQLKARFDRVCEPLCGPNAKAVSDSGGSYNYSFIPCVFSVTLIAILKL